MGRRRRNTREGGREGEGERKELEEEDSPSNYNPFYSSPVYSFLSILSFMCVTNSYLTPSFSRLDIFSSYNLLFHLCKQLSLSCPGVAFLLVMPEPCFLLWHSYLYLVILSYLCLYRFISITPIPHMLSPCYHALHTFLVTLSLCLTCITTLLFDSTCVSIVPPCACNYITMTRTDSPVSFLFLNNY